MVGGVAGLLTSVAARGWFIAPLLGPGGGVWASCRYWGPPCLRSIQAASCFNMALGLLVLSCLGHCCGCGFQRLPVLLGVPGRRPCDIRSATCIIASARLVYVVHVCYMLQLLTRLLYGPLRLTPRARFCLSCTNSATAGPSKRKPWRGMGPKEPLMYSLASNHPKSVLQRCANSSTT